MPRLPVLSGREIIKILSKHGFEIVGRKDSHVRMKKVAPEKIYITVVPDHKEVPVGTPESIIWQSGISEE
jgi:predicted RNA binding protein YcfA (HicA-like mRNA interferase family)